MLNRRQFVTRSLQGSSLLALSSIVPGFLANTAQAAEVGKDSILVVIELTGGNDGLNTVIPYTDELYHKYRPTLRFTGQQVIKVDKEIGLHPGMKSFDTLLQKNELAVVQGVGYPNPDRSHFEAMDIWQSADPKRQIGTGWIARSAPDLQDKRGSVPIMQIGPSRLPLALQGSNGGAVSINNQRPFLLELGGGNQKQRRKLMENLAKPNEPEDDTSLLQFVQRRQVQTYTTLERLQELLKTPIQPNPQFPVTGLSQKLGLVSRLIEKGFGTRVFYVSLDGFDTHSGQAPIQEGLLRELADGVTGLFADLKKTGHDKRVIVMTFSEFGRRVGENGSKGTDHGAGSCLFVAGPAVKGGPLGKHPSLSDLDAGDLKWHIDFRRIYATLLDKWLGCDSKTVLVGRHEHVDLLRGKA
jgi:uncharacterized protein (DUF1501 family)